MRFAASSRFSAGDYATAAQAGANSLIDAFAAARRNSPDWTGLARTAMNTRSAERQAAMKTEAEVAVAGMRAFGNVKETQIKGAYDLETTKTKIKTAKNARKAGRLGALGGFKMPKKSSKKHYDNYINKLEGMKQTVPAVGEGSGSQSPQYNDSGFSPYNPEGHLQHAPKPPVNPSSPPTNVQPVAANGSGGMDLSSLSDEDKKYIAYTVSGEAARGTDDIYGVAGVVLNRMRSDKYPSTAKGVAFQPGQFEAVEIGTARHEPELVNKLFSTEGMAKIQSAMSTLAGRDSFKGQTMLKHRVAEEDPMFHQRGNFYHHSWQS